MSRLIGVQRNVGSWHTARRSKFFWFKLGLWWRRITGSKGVAALISIAAHVLLFVSLARTQPTRPPLTHSIIHLHLANSGAAQSKVTKTVVKSAALTPLGKAPVIAGQATSPRKVAKHRSHPAQVQVPAPALAAKPISEVPSAFRSVPRSEAGRARDQAGTAVSTSTAPAGGSSAAVSLATGAHYMSTLQQLIDAAKLYPAQALARHQTGRVEVGFTIRRSGMIENVRIVTPSNFSALNAAALAAVEAVGKYAEIPETIGRETWAMVVPIVFSIN